MDVDSAVEAALADPAEGLSATSRWTNLNTFSGRGGKLIFWHGVSDPWFSALDTVEYYERMTHYPEAGRYDLVAGGGLEPETDSTTYNGAVWLLARRTYWADPARRPIPHQPSGCERWPSIARARTINSTGGHGRTHRSSIPRSLD
jgi:hypothetical protein